MAFQDIVCPADTSGWNVPEQKTLGIGLERAHPAYYNLWSPGSKARIIPFAPGRRRSQIEEALKSKALKHFVLVVTPEALEIDASQSGEGSARS